MVTENQEMVMEKSWKNNLSSMWEPCFILIYVRYGTQPLHSTTFCLGQVPQNSNNNAIHDNIIILIDNTS